MSKERDLLKRWFNEFGRICCNKNLLIETKELLAKRQPEPFNPDWANYRQGVEDAKRKPLSDAAIGNLYYTAVKDNEHGAIQEFARAIEKAHGIGEIQ